MAAASGPEAAFDPGEQSQFNLDVPDDVAFCAERFEGEWQNGGLAQLFANWMPADTAILPCIMRTIGAEGAAKVMERAIEFMGPPSEWQDRGHRALLGKDRELSDRLWAFDGELDSHWNEFDEKLERSSIALDERYNAKT